MSGTVVYGLSMSSSTLSKHLLWITFSFNTSATIEAGQSIQPKPIPGSSRVYRGRRLSIIYDPGVGYKVGVIHTAINKTGTPRRREHTTRQVRQGEGNTQQDRYAKEKGTHNKTGAPRRREHTTRQVRQGEGNTQQDRYAKEKGTHNKTGTPRRREHTTRQVRQGEGNTQQDRCAKEKGTHSKTGAPRRREHTARG